jgi:hypothetical protein
MNRSLLRSLQITLLVVFAGWTNFLQANDWHVGVVFVGVGNGKYKVYDNQGKFKEEIDPGQGGLTGGCAFDSTYHLVTTNISNAKVLRYKIDHPHGVLQTINPASQTSGAGSVVFAGNGDFYVGDPAAGAIRKYNHAGVLQVTYPVAVENAGSNWIDLTADGKTIFYTSEGRLVKRFDVFNNAQLLDFVDLGNAGGSNVRLYAVRVLSDGGLLVADKKNIKRLNSSGAVVKEYDAAGQDDWRSLNLDPIDPINPSFWAGDATSGRFYRFNIATGGAPEVGPVNTQSGNLSGICVDGGFSAAQASPQVFPSVVVTAANPTARFAPDASNEFVVTLNGLEGSEKLTARVSVIDKNAGFSDASFGPTNNRELPCTTTKANGEECIVWNVEASPGSKFSSADVQIEQNNTTSNTRALKNEATDFTTFVADLDPGGRTRTFSVFSLNQASVIGNAVSCGLQNLSDGSVFQADASITFQFKAAVEGGNCKNGPFLTTLRPRLSVVRLVEGRAPEAVEIQAAGISDFPPFYRLLADGTYKLNMKLKVEPPAVPAGDYLATTFDDSGQIPAFWVQFSLR